MAVTQQILGSALVLTIENPPLNVVGLSVRQGLLAGLTAAASNGGISRVIVTGAGPNFCAGADAREFSTPPVPPHLPDLLAMLETLGLPTIAAINGAALGGGLEIALACQYRIAAATARLGLPEVTLGVVPGAGGTQRLPRLVGMAKALDLIAQGKVIGAAEAAGLGLVDQIADDALAAALALPDAVLAATLPAHRRPDPVPDAAALADARATARHKLPGQIAPQSAIDLIEASVQPLAVGLAQERAMFLALRSSPQAHALRHAFFAERTAMSQSRRIGADPVAVDCAVVVGGGNMGASIAYALASVGVDVTIVETDAAGAARARANVAGLYADAVRRGKFTADAAKDAQSRLHRFAIGYDALPPAQIAIEAAFEDMGVKQAIFARLAAALPAQALLASNTSYLDVNQIAEYIPQRDRVLGLHFFSPAHVMKLLEVIRADETSETAMATALRLAARLGKIPVLAGVCDGFIGNRILTRYRQTTDIAMLLGALPWQTDAALRAFGFAMGPYEVQDLSGLDIAYANRKRLGLKDNPAHRYVPIADRMVQDLGRLGRKTRAGWYDYADGQPPQPSPLVADLIRDAAVGAGITPRAMPDIEVQDRALTAMIEEACHILDEGIAAKPADIDLVLLHGYGFPRWRGGLMHYADTIGPAVLLARIERYAAEDPLSWHVPDLLHRLVRDGRTFDSLN